MERNADIRPERKCGVNADSQQCKEKNPRFVRPNQIFGLRTLKSIILNLLESRR